MVVVDPEAIWVMSTKNGIISKWLDGKAYNLSDNEGRLRLSSDWDAWQYHILPKLAKFFTFWTRERAKYPIDFQELISAGDSLPYTDERTANLQFNYERGKNLQMQKEIQVYIFDKYDPWWNTPSRNPDPLITESYTDAWETVVVNYVPPQMNEEIYRERHLSRAISLELWHLILKRKFKPVSVFDGQVHEEFEKGNWAYWDEKHERVAQDGDVTFQTLGGAYE